MLPREIMTEARKLKRDAKAKNDYRKTLDNIKIQLELDQRDANQDSAYSREIEENKKSFSAQFNNFNEKKEASKPTLKKKKFSPGHFCNRSKSCKREWEFLGCAELYKLHTVDERKEFLKERERCYMCGAKDFPTHSCMWKRNMKFNMDITSARCTKSPGLFSAHAQTIRVEMQVRN